MGRLSFFLPGQRVQVARPNHPLYFRFGVVVCPLKPDHFKGAHWINLEGELSDAFRSYPADDPFDRGNHVLLWPSDCRAADNLTSKGY